MSNESQRYFRNVLFADESDATETWQISKKNIFIIIFIKKGENATCIVIETRPKRTRNPIQMYFFVKTLNPCIFFVWYFPNTVYPKIFWQYRQQEHYQKLCLDLDAQRGWWKSCRQEIFSRHHHTSSIEASLKRPLSIFLSTTPIIILTNGYCWCVAQLLLDGTLIFYKGSLELWSFIQKYL